MLDMKDFAMKGFSRLPGAIATEDLNQVRDIGLLAIQAVYPTAKNLQDSNWVQKASARPDLVAEAYGLLQNHSFLHSLGLNEKMWGIACSLLNDPLMYEKVAFRIDVPHETKEMAWWHWHDPLQRVRVM